MTLMDRRMALMATQGGGFEHGTWEDLFWHIDHGSYKRAYAVGEVLPLNAGSEGDINAQIVAFDADDLADGSGKAPVTIIAKYLLIRNVNIGGSVTRWEDTTMRNYMRNTVLPSFPEDIRSRIVEVQKSSGYNGSDTEYIHDSITADTIWAPSYREMFGGTLCETTGPVYTEWFASNARRIKQKANTPTTATNYRLRTQSAGGPFYTIGAGGAAAKNVGNNFGSGGCVGFCIG